LGYLGLPWATLGYLGLPWATLGYLGLPWATLGYLGLYLYWVSHQHCPSTWTPILSYFGLPWPTLGFFVLPSATYQELLWATLSYIRRPLVYTFGVLGLPRAIRGILGRPWVTLGFRNTYTGCPINIVQLMTHTWTPILGLIIALLRPRLLRSNFPRSALCATLDSYNL
jgi:hypothetical protein